MLTQTELAQLRESFDDLSDEVNEATSFFFARLFALDPRLRFLFPDDLEEQRCRFVFMAAFIIRHADNLEEIETTLRNLGVRHVAYGVRDADFSTFAVAMDDTLSHFLRAESGDGIRGAWAKVFDAVAATMRKGACPVSCSVK